MNHELVIKIPRELSYDGLVQRILLLALLVPFHTGLLQAQPVRAPEAQKLIDVLLQEHSEIQTIGLHVTPPGLQDNVNIACSKPGKVGKKSADIDMEVMATGKPSLRMANKGAFDIGVPIGDREGRKLGMIVVVIPAARAKDGADALRQVLAIRDILQSRIASKEALFLGATLVDAPMVMIAQTPLPGVRGGFGKMSVDLAENRLMAPAIDNHTVELFDLNGEHLKSLAQDIPDKVLPPVAMDDVNRRTFTIGVENKIEVLASGRKVATLEGAGEPGDLTFDQAGRRLFLTGSEGIVVYRQVDPDHYQLLCRFNTMGGNRSLYVPSKKLFYIIHGKNSEDGAGLQVYEVR